MLNLILITHEGIGSSMIKVAEAIIGQPMKNTTCFEVPMDSDTRRVIESVSANVETTELDTLILTDLLGSTPFNVAANVAQRYQTSLVSGLNLAMLLRVYNYRAYQLEEVTEMAVGGGRSAITANQDSSVEYGNQ